MKILFLNTNIGYGGASKMLVWVANILVEYGFDVTFATYRDTAINQDLSKKVRLIHFMTEQTGGHSKNIIKTIHYLRKYIKKNRFDLAIAFLSPSQLRLSIACIGLNTKLLFSQRGDPYQSSNQTHIGTILSQWAFTQADKYIFQTIAARDYYPTKIREKSAVIANPIKKLIRTCIRVGNVENRIVCVARLDISQKRQDLLIDAFNSISSNYPDYVLELYGDGADEATLKEMAKCNPNIRFMGKVDNISEAIQNAAISVLTSDYEGIPNALLESMSLGIPCISTDCSPGGAAMLITNKQNGLLIPCRDVKALANAMAYMLDNKKDAERMGKRAMSVNELYSETNIANRWINFISNL